MFTISPAKTTDSLNAEWRKLDAIHFGKPVEWVEKSFIFKAEENGKLIGLIEGKYEPGVLFISALMTAQAARGKGVGTALIERAEAFGKELGAHKTWLTTGKHWSENAFYQKLGFQKIADLPDFYLHVDFVIYIRDIK